MSKGSKRRPMSVPRETFDKNWDDAFARDGDALVAKCTQVRDALFADFHDRVLREECRLSPEEIPAPLHTPIESYFVTPLEPEGERPCSEDENSNVASNT